MDSFARNFAVLLESVTKAKSVCGELQVLSERAQELVELSSEKDHLYEVAGDIIQGVPTTLTDLNSALDKALFVSASILQEDLKNKLPFDDVESMNLTQKVATRFLVATYVSRP